MFTVFISHDPLFFISNENFGFCVNLNILSLSLALPNQGVDFMLR